MTARLPMSEARLQDAIIDAARVHSWLVHHQRPARVRVDGADTYRSAIAGDKGFPDLVLSRARAGVGRLVLAELKSTRGKVSPEQQAWLDTLRAVEGIEVYVWYPADLDAALEILR